MTLANYCQTFFMNRLKFVGVNAQCIGVKVNSDAQTGRCPTRGGGVVSQDYWVGPVLTRVMPKCQNGGRQ